MSSTTTTTTTTTTDAAATSSAPRATDTTTAPDAPHEEHQYLDLVRRILDSGLPRADRTGTGTLSLFAPPSFRFTLRGGALPLLTTKRVFTRGIIAELVWFISGSTSSEALSALGAKIWDANGSRANLDALGFTARAAGDLGPVYGFQWRHFGARYVDSATDYAGQGVDQLAAVIGQIRADPASRRIVLSAWNPADLAAMVLPPCHMFCQFFVDPAARELSCCLYQRSADMGLGVPFNIASYALLTHMLAHVCGLRAAEFVHCIGDAHVYRDHIDPLKDQLAREPRPWPSVRIRTPGGGGLEELEAIKVEDIEIEGYEPWPAIKMKMSV